MKYLLSFTYLVSIHVNHVFVHVSKIYVFKNWTYLVSIHVDFENVNVSKTNVLEKLGILVSIQVLLVPIHVHFI
jgi:hypothetical protein